MSNRTRRAESPFSSVRQGLEAGLFGLDEDERADWQAGNEIRAALAQLAHIEGVVRLIAAGKRPDGTYNRGREACEQLAKGLLGER